MRLWADLDEYKSNHYGSYLIFAPHDEISLAVQKKTVQLGFPKIDFAPSRVSIGKYRVKKWHKVKKSTFQEMILDGFFLHIRVGLVILRWKNIKYTG